MGSDLAHKFILNVKSRIKCGLRDEEEFRQKGKEICFIYCKLIVQYSAIRN